MIFRPLTAICAFAALGAGLFLYSEKHRTALVDRDIAQLIEHSQAARERIGVLRTEWQLLNNPDVLRERSDKYLHLQAMEPSHYVKLADLGAHLPGPLAPGAVPSADDAVVVGAADGADGGAIVVASGETMPSGGHDGGGHGATDEVPVKPHADTQVASLQIAEKMPVRAGVAIAAKTDVKAKPHNPVHHTATPASHGQAPNDMSGLPRGAPLPLAAPQSIGATVVSAMAHTGMAQTGHRAFMQPAIVSAVPRYATAAMPVSSSLGMASRLPPPVPLPADER